MHVCLFVPLQFSYGRALQATTLKVGLEMQSFLLQHLNPKPYLSRAFKALAVLTLAVRLEPYAEAFKHSLSVCHSACTLNSSNAVYPMTYGPFYW